eukprot:g59421.t1
MNVILCTCARNFPALSSLINMQQLHKATPKQKSLASTHTKKQASMADYNAMDDEDEFSGRDAMGLMEKVEKGEEETRRFYFKMVGVLNFLFAPVICWVTYGLTKMIDKQKELYESKFNFIHDNQLGYVFIAWYAIYLARTYVSINANGARAAARVDRPDQHIYKVMAASGVHSGMPFVLMANSGPEGRFNRAQRALYNMEETIAFFLTGVILAGAVFPFPVLGCVVLACYGRIKFANLYKESLKKRGAGFLPAIIGEVLVAGFVGVCMVKGVAGPDFPI